MPPYALSDPGVLSFILIPLALVLSLTWGVAWSSSRTGDGSKAVRRGTMVLVGAGGWMLATWLAAASGWLRQWDAVPPPFAIFFLSIVAVSIWIARGPWGRLLATAVPLCVLVGVQGFRLPLELAMHAMATRGIMPPQMSYSGLNYDILTGVTAILVAALVRAGIGSTSLVKVWNLFGFVLLVNIVTIAVASTPAFRFFGEERLNVWVTYPPFVWLPAVMVVAALAGHLIVWRALGRGAANVG